MTTRVMLWFSIVSMTSGCYQSTPYTGDTGIDTSIDTGVDTIPDTIADTIWDTYFDPPYDTHTDTYPYDVPPSDCPPPPADGTWMSWIVDGGEWWDETWIDTPCIVMDVFTDGSMSLIHMMCGTGGFMEEHFIEIDSNPPVWPSLYPGMEVQFRYISEPVWWVNRWFTISDVGGQLRLAGVDAEWISPWAYPAEEWYWPLGVDVMYGLCGVEEDWCGIYERQGLFVNWYDDGGIVYDGYADWVGWWGSVFAHVSYARTYHEMWCEDMAGQFYSALFSVNLEG
jgi:hypothetical protein